MKIDELASLLRNIVAQTVVMVVFVLAPMMVFAQGSPCPSGEFCNPLGNITLVAFLEKVLNAVVLIAFPILVLFLVYAGFLFVSARGSEEKITRAKQVFLWTFIGALLVLGAWTLSQAIKGTVDEIRGVRGIQETRFL